MHQATSIGISAEMQRCIDECMQCHAICLKTAAHCLAQGGEHAEPEHIRALLDCAESCATSANTMLRGSALHGAMCGVCARFCDQCAESCESISADATMRACAEACRRCAESCREMEKMAA